MALLLVYNSYLLHRWQACLLSLGWFDFSVLGRNGLTWDELDKAGGFDSGSGAKWLVAWEHRLIKYIMTSQFWPLSVYGIACKCIFWEEKRGNQFKIVICTQSLGNRLSYQLALNYIKSQPVHGIIKTEQKSAVVNIFNTMYRVLPPHILNFSHHNIA